MKHKRITGTHRAATTVPVVPTVLAALIGAALALVGTSVDADAGQPYGGCDEAWQAPKSAGADDCRDLGWTVRKRVVLNPHGILRYWNMPTCEFEDGSGDEFPCGWLGQADGNGRGLSYFFTGTYDNHTATYLWSPSPLMGHPKREWVDSGLADALAEGDSDGATTRDWSQCWTNGERVVCPDGHREVL